ncbi:MAG: protein translocase subunit SecD [Proteobacteria bacterium]|nr:protein translocase subunit SecD [Pseudomonadota bacterium]
MVHYPQWKAVLVLLACLAGMLYALPNMIPKSTLEQLPRWLPARQVSLGLDLRGGSHLLLEVDVNAVRTERLNSILDGVRTALRAAKGGYVNLGITGDAVTFKLRDPSERDTLLSTLQGVDNEAAVTMTPDGDGVVRLSELAVAARRKAAVEQSIEIVRRRIDETGTREPTIIRQGEDRILVQLPGVDDPERMKALLGKTAKLVFRLVDLRATPVELTSGRAPAGSEILFEESRQPGQPPVPMAIQRRVIVSGENLVDAQATFQNGEPVVSFKFDSIGARRFGDTTVENVGKPFAIVLDNKVISAPVVREPILGGSGVISGSFSVQSAQDLALLLRAGALPAPLTVVEERTVGPGLGADSIAAGVNASILGGVLVVGFMLVAYGLFGIFANIALFFNMVLIVALLSALGATLTLPGIAGMVLTMGMAVDANVLIYERMREEIRNGRSVIAAVDAGFQRAFATIIDSNLTHVIAGVLLFGLGSGPIRGFAVTLVIGIATSIFTAIMVTRLLIVRWLMWTRPKALPI